MYIDVDPPGNSMGFLFGLIDIDCWNVFVQPIICCIVPFSFTFGLFYNRAYKPVFLHTVCATKTVLEHNVSFLFEPNTFCFSLTHFWKQNLIPYFPFLSNRCFWDFFLSLYICPSLDLDLKSATSGRDLACLRTVVRLKPTLLSPRSRSGFQRKSDLHEVTSGISPPLLTLLLRSY